MNNNSEAFHLKGLLYVHNAVRRDADLFYNKLNGSHKITGDEIKNIEKWFNNYFDMLYIHHSSEDNIFFPALINKSSEIKNIIENLEKQHKDMDLCLKEIQSNLKDFNEEKLIKLKNETLNLKNHIFSHAEEEEKYLIPATVKYLTKKEQVKLENKLHFHVPPLKIGYLISWMMEDLPSAQRIDFYNSLPFPIRILYKLFWRERFNRIQNIIK